MGHDELFLMRFGQENCTSERVDMVLEKRRREHTHHEVIENFWSFREGRKCIKRSRAQQQIFIYVERALR
jgi:hypothetical protein